LRKIICRGQETLTQHPLLIKKMIFNQKISSDVTLENTF